MLTAVKSLLMVFAAPFNDCTAFTCCQPSSIHSTKATRNVAVAGRSHQLAAE
jgi:hypothetical protein